MTMEPVSALGSEDPEERRRGVSGIAAAAEDEQPSLLVAALGDRDWRVRKEAVGVASGLTATEAVLGALIRVLGPGDNVGLRNAAVEAIGSFGPRAVAALRTAIRELDADGRKLAAEALARTSDPAAIGALEALLDDDDVNVRMAAIEAIGGIGATDVPRSAALLERCLVSDDTLAVLSALEGLNRLGVAVAWQLLRPLLANPALKEAVLVAAGLSGHPDAAVQLSRALATAEGRLFRMVLGALATFVMNEPASRRSARKALGTLPEPARRRILDIARTPSDEPELRRCALLVTGALGTAEAADAVIDALGDDQLGSEAEQALTMLGPAAILGLARRARDGEPRERAACVEQLGQLADESTRSIACQAILDATEDGAPEVVRSALGALSLLGDEGTFGLAARWLTAEAPPAVRHSAAAALAAAAVRFPEAARALAAEARPDGLDAAVAAVIMAALPEPVLGSTAADVAFLAEAASSESTVVRRAAVDALARSTTPAAVDAVAFALADEAPEVQLAAIRALGRMRDDHGRPMGLAHLLEVARTFTEEELGVAAIDALGAAGDPMALEVLRGVARQGTPIRAVAAVGAIGGIEAPGRVDALIHALSHPEAEVVKAALRAVAGEERDPRAQAHVAACLDHEAWDVRRLAAELLALRPDPHLRHLLRQRLTVEKEPLVREEIQRTLSEGEGGTVRKTMPPLGGGVG